MLNSYQIDAIQSIHKYTSMNVHTPGEQDRILSILLREMNYHETIWTILKYKEQDNLLL